MGKGDWAPLHEIQRGRPQGGPEGMTGPGLGMRPGKSLPLSGPRWLSHYKTSALQAVLGSLLPPLPEQQPQVLLVADDIILEREDQVAQGRVQGVVIEMLLCGRWGRGSE